MLPISFSHQDIVVPQAMEPFFQSFNPPVQEEDIKKQMIKFLLEDISRMIAKTLKKAKLSLESF
ncbi:MAG: hypothetical protein KBC64_06340 [Simkaniaceae bacterium]|nr:hypothetical protein [Simkaniaceae bacterium]